MFDSTSQGIQQFPQIGRKFAAPAQSFARDRVHEPKLGGV